MAPVPPPPPAKAPPALSYGVPNQTLYCSNLPDKLQKSDLRRSLYLLFSTYGAVLDVVALKTPKMRGQAHVVFRDIDASMQALRALQGFEFFGKEMKIAYGKGKSDTIAKLDGTFKIPVTAPAAPPSTDLQKSIFDAPPSAETSHGAAGDDTMANANKAPQGVKRTRDEEDEDDASMDEDDDAMDVSDSD